MIADVILLVKTGCVSNLLEYHPNKEVDFVVAAASVATCLPAAAAEEEEVRRCRGVELFAAARQEEPPRWLLEGSTIRRLDCNKLMVNRIQNYYETTAEELLSASGSWRFCVHHGRR